MVIIYAVLSIIFMTLFTFLLRVAPLWRQRYRGVDAYYFLLTAQEFKKHKRIPIKLPPYYLLDIEEQWYPPGFSLFLGLLPERIVDRFYWLISPILDVINLVVLLVFTYFQTFSLEHLFLAGFVYASTPVLTAESTSLTSRALGNLFLTGEILSLAFYNQPQSGFFLILAVVFGFLIFATHKMTTQFLVFFHISLSIIFQTVLPLFVLVSIFVLALIVLRSYFFKILKGHYDILLFWHRNWEYLGAHQIYTSPVYGKSVASDQNNLADVRKSYLSRMKSTIARENKAIYFLLRSIIGKSSNPFVVLALLYGLWSFATFTAMEWVIFSWAFLAFLLMLLTIFVPYLRVFGEGFKYMRATAFPVAFIVSQFFVSGNVPVAGLVFGFIVFSIAAGRCFLIYKELSRVSIVGALLDEDLMKVFKYIKNNPEIDYIACFSVNFADALVYYCRRHVLWGTHHDSFNDKVVDFYPVMRKPLKWFKERYGIRYALIDTSYVKPHDMDLMEEQIVLGSGKYVLYKLNS